VTEPPWRIRVGRPDDRQMLSRFQCADPTVPWQVEVEAFIRTDLVEWVFEPHAADNDPRLLLLFERSNEQLVGVAAHERQELVGGGDGEPIAATKIEVVALAAAWQGVRFGTGERASDVLLSTVMADVAARVPPRDARVFALVHTDNMRSLALCRRHGLIEEMSPVGAYRRLVTAHRPR